MRKIKFLQTGKEMKQNKKKTHPKKRTDNQ